MLQNLNFIKTQGETFVGNSKEEVSNTENTRKAW